MGWNGLDLVNDFSSELGDTSPAFKSKVLRYINEGIKDIATMHRWPFLREKGKVVLTAGLDTHLVPLAKPSAPTLALSAGGSLTDATTYSVLVTFFEAQSGIESIAGEASAGLLTATPNLTLDITTLPVSLSPLVTERRLYLSKAGASFVYHSSVMDNTTLTAQISSNTSGQITPPEEHYISVLDGDFYLEDNRVLKGVSLQDLIFSTNGTNSSGTPDSWAAINQLEIQVNPTPVSSVVASFYYFKIPAKVFGVSTSVPQIPSYLYDDLRNYVIWRGFAFRDRSGKESMKLNYDQGLAKSISRKGKPTKKSGRVRCVSPDSDGYGV